MPIIDELATMPDLCEPLFGQVPASLLDWKPVSWEGMPGEHFSILGQACHLRDIETDGYHVRFSRTLREHRPDLVSIDSYAMADQRHYGSDDVRAALGAFRSARAETVTMLQKVRPDDWARRATFAEHGEVTLRGLAHILRSHDLQHLACLHWLLARIESGT
jgi:hypothetical protein